MRYRKILRILSIAVILSLLVTVIPAIPAMAATIAISPTSGPVGTVVTVIGSGFGPDLALSITMSDSEVAWPNSTSSGTIASGTTFTVPSSKAAGTHTIGVLSYGSISSPASYGTPVTISPAVTFTVTGGGTASDAEIDLYPDEGTVGTEVEIEGNDFSAEEGIEVFWDEVDNDNELDIIDGDDETDDDGDFNTYIVIPESYAGEHTIIVKDDDDIEAEEEFTVEPAITISPTSGTPNTDVTITGTGFGRNADVTIYFVGSAITTAEADSSGSFEALFLAPDISPGTYDIEAEDDDDNADSTQFTLEIEAKADISKTDGNVGTKITVSGIGFTPGGTVTITYDGTAITTTTADTNGAFSASFDAPPSSGGQHTVAATNGGITKEFTFTMESTPPAVPEAQLPPPGVSLVEEEEVTFDWSDVDDPSGVTYTFQIATDKTFAEDSVVIEKKELAESEYTLTEVEQESLVPAEESEEKEVTYYWRVKATDSASNESDWESASSFVVPRPGFAVDLGMPSWAIYAFFALGAIILGLVGFWLGRRTAYY